MDAWIVCPPFLFLWILETKPQVALAGLELTILLKLFLNFSSSCLHFLSAGIPGTSHNTSCINGVLWASKEIKNKATHTLTVALVSTAPSGSWAAPAEGVQTLTQHHGLAGRQH